MPKITFWRPGSFQHAEIDNSAMTWRVIPPHDQSSKRLLKVQNGKMKNTATVPNTSIAPLVMDHVDQFGRGLFLGYGLNFSNAPANQTNWREGSMMNKEEIKGLEHYNQYNRPSITNYNKFLWSTSPIVNKGNIWLGIFIGTNISIGAARARAFAGVIWQLDKTNKMYIVVGDAGYVCAGLGVTGDVSIGVFTGFPQASRISGFAKHEFGLSVSLGSNFSTLANCIGAGSQVATKLGSVINQVKNLKPLLELVEEYGKITSHRDKFANAVKYTEKAYKVGSNKDLLKAMAKPAAELNNSEIVKLILMSLGVDGSKEGMEFMKFGAGLELSAFGGTAQVTGVYGI